MAQHVIRAGSPTSHPRFAGPLVGGSRRYYYNNAIVLFLQEHLLSE